MSGNQGTGNGNRAAAARAGCQDETCHRGRGLWQRLGWRRHAGLWLHQEWYCSPQCFEKALQRSLARACGASLPVPPAQHRFPLGLLMLSRGQLTNSQLRRALAEQESRGRGRIGRWLEELGFASETQVTAALGLQWACPILPPAATEDFACEGMLPLRLLETFHMLPVRFVASTRILYMAFSEDVDYTALYAIERMLGYRTEPCLVNHSSMERALERLRNQRCPDELLFEGWRDSAEMARITAGYALKLGAHEVRVTACGEHIWARLERAQGHTNLLFPRPSPAADLPPAEHRWGRRAAG